MNDIKQTLLQAASAAIAEAAPLAWEDMDGDAHSVEGHPNELAPAAVIAVLRVLADEEAWMYSHYLRSLADEIEEQGND